MPPEVYYGRIRVRDGDFLSNIGLVFQPWELSTIFV